MPGQRKNSCSLGRILYNWQNKYNKDGKIIHINVKRWNGFLSRHPELLGYYSDVVETIEDYSEKEEQPKFKKVKYVKRFKQHVPIEVVVMYDEDSKYCVIHVMFQLGKVIAMKWLWKVR